MKLEHVKIILDVQDFKIFEYPHISHYRDLFDQCLSWVGVNLPGSCCLELCPLQRVAESDNDNNYQEQIVCFFTLDERGRSPLVRQGSPIYALNKRYHSQEVFFTIRAWPAPIPWRMSIDWCSTSMRPRGDTDFVPFDDHVDLEMSRFVLKDRFYIMERT
jgi:hypothetical protein